MIEFWLGIGMGAGLGNSLDIGAMAGGGSVGRWPPAGIFGTFPNPGEIFGVMFPVDKSKNLWAMTVCDKILVGR